MQNCDACPVQFRWTVRNMEEQAFSQKWNWGSRKTLVCLLKKYQKYVGESAMVFIGRGKITSLSTPWKQCPCLAAFTHSITIVAPCRWLILNKYKLAKCIASFRTSVNCQRNQITVIQSFVRGWWSSSTWKCGPLARQQQLLINLGNKRGKKKFLRQLGLERK